MRRLIAYLLLALALSTSGALAQATPTPMGTSTLGGEVILSVTNASSSVQLPSPLTPFGTVTLYNKGTTDAYFALGGSTVAATSGGTCTGFAGPSCLLAAGTSVTIWANTATYVAAITASSSTSIIVYQSNGPLALRGSVSSGTSSVTSFNSRTGAVVPATNDYSFSQLSGALAASQCPAATTSALGCVSTDAAATLSNTSGAIALNLAHANTWTATITDSNAAGVTLSGTPGASQSTLTSTSAPFTGGTATTNFPTTYVNCSGATAPSSFSTSGTFLGFNSCSAFAGNYIDAHLNGGSSVFSVNSAGNVTTTQLKDSATAIIGGTSNATVTAGTTDGTTYCEQVWLYGGNSGGSYFCGQTTTTFSSGVAKTVITVPADGGDIGICGSDGTNRFCDRVNASLAAVQSVCVTTCGNIAGSPTTRTYTNAGSGAIQLSLATGTSYAVRASGVVVGQR